MIDIRRADTRPHTDIGWLDSHHSFSFGRHYDRDNTHHGLLLVNNDDERYPSWTGFDLATCWGLDTANVMKVSKGGAVATVPPGNTPGNASILLNQVTSDRHDNAAGHCEAVGFANAPGERHVLPGTRFHLLINQPFLCFAQQVADHQPGRLVPALDAPDREAGVA